MLWFYSLLGCCGRGFHIIFNHRSFSILVKLPFREWSRKEKNGKNEWIKWIKINFVDLFKKTKMASMRCPVPPWSCLSTRLYTYMNKRLLTAAQERQASVTNIKVEQLLRFVTFCRVYRLKDAIYSECYMLWFQYAEVKISLCQTFSGLALTWWWDAESLHFHTCLLHRAQGGSFRFLNSGVPLKQKLPKALGMNWNTKWDAIMLFYCVLYITVWKKACSVEPN